MIEQLPVRVTWDQDTSWPGFVHELARVNAIRAVDVVGSDPPLKTWESPSNELLEKVAALSGVPAAVLRTGCFGYRYPHVRGRPFFFRRVGTVACPQCGPYWLTEWRSGLVVTCRRCGNLLRQTDPTEVDDPPEAGRCRAVPAHSYGPAAAEAVRALGEWYLRLLADPTAEAGRWRDRIYLNFKRICTTMTRTWPPAAGPGRHFVDAARPTALSALRSDPKSWRRPEVAAVLLGLAWDASRTKAATRDLLESAPHYEPLRAAQVNGWGVWCPDCRGRGDIRQRRGLACICERCGLLLTDRLGYTEDIADPALVAACLEYTHAADSIDPQQRKRADRALLLYRMARPLLTSSWPLRGPTEPAGRREAALRIRASREKGSGFNKTVIAALLPAVWEASASSKAAGDFVADGTLHPLTGWHHHTMAPDPADTVRSVRADLHAAFADLGMGHRHLPGMLLPPGPHVLPARHEWAARTALVRAISREMIRSVIGKAPSIADLSAAEGFMTWGVSRAVTVLTTTVPGLRLTLDATHDIAHNGLVDWDRAAAHLDHVRTVPPSVLRRTSFAGQENAAQLAAAWVWNDATGAQSGGPYPKHRPAVHRFDQHITPEDRLTLREYWVDLLGQTDRLASASAPVPTHARTVRDAG